MSNTATSQADENRRRNPSPLTGQVLPAGFEAHPERRNNKGYWKKEDSARFKLEQMLKLDEDQLKKVFEDPKASLFERKLAGCIANGDWKQLEGMMNQVYGMPKQNVEVMPIEKPVPLSPRKQHKLEQIDQKGKLDA